MNFNANEYFKSKSFFGFLFKKIRSGELWRLATSVYSGIRKYTLISGIIRAVGFTVALLEKSAVLLLVFTVIILILPLVLLALLIYFLACVIKHFYVSPSIGKWLTAEQPVTVFITAQRVFTDGEKRLFLRTLEAQAQTLTGPVIVVCADTFLCAKWYSLNVLAVRTEYFFTVRRRFIEKNLLNATYIVL